MGNAKREEVSSKELPVIMSKTAQNNASSLKLLQASSKSIKKKQNAVFGSIHKSTNEPRRLLSAHTVKTLASGAAAVAARRLQIEAASVCAETLKERPRLPALPSFSRGATNMLEGFLSGVAQQAMTTATMITLAATKNQKATAVAMQLGCDFTIDALYQPFKAPGLVEIDLSKKIAPKVDHADTKDVIEGGEEEEEEEEEDDDKKLDETEENE